MKWRIIIAMMIVPIIFVETYGISKAIKSNPIPTGNIINKIQYNRKGAPFKDFGEAPFAVIFDNTDKSFRISWPEKCNPDSFYYHFIPGDQVVIRIAAEVEWIESLKMYNYEYIVYSDSNSICSIWHFEVEWWNYYKDIISPTGWLSGTIRFQPRKVTSWSVLKEINDLNPGQFLSGFGFQSIAPPVVAPFAVWGRPKELEQVGLELLNESDAEEFMELCSDISSQRFGIKGYTVIPGVCPEIIDPVEWCFHIDVGLNRISESGYIDDQYIKNVHQILYGLQRTFGNTESHSLQKLQDHINVALIDLQPYQNQIEPEAWAFITENLKYVLRQMDIVRFREYP